MVKNFLPVNLRAFAIFCAIVLLTFGCRAQSKVKNPPTNNQAVKSGTTTNQTAAPVDSKVEFTSVYTKLDSKTCQPLSVAENDEEVPDICDGYKDYKILVSHHGTATKIYIGTEISKNTDLWDTAELPMFIANNAGNGQTIEWRLADGEPFACIVRAEYNKSIINPDEKGTANELVVKNLKGFAPINIKIDAQKNKRANEEARQRADSAYQKL